MKRIIALLLASVLCLSLVSCYANSEAVNEEENEENEEKLKAVSYIDPEYVGEWRWGEWGPDGIPTTAWYFYFYNLILNDDGSALYQDGFIDEGEDRISSEQPGVWVYYPEFDAIFVTCQSNHYFKISKKDGKTILTDVYWSDDGRELCRAEDFVVPEFEK